jgi:3-hydroxyisobutyrate dehydrogenase
MVKAGMIGLGAMGVGMARNVAEAGLLTAVYNRTRKKAEILANDLGVIAVQSPDELAAIVDVILICVSADQDVLEMVTAITPTIKPGSVVVDMSTVSNATVEQAVAILAEKQVDFLDAPVSGGTEGAKNGNLAMMLGGNTEAFEKARPVLEAMTSRIIHVGDNGTGQGTKAVNQIMAAGINQAVTEALAFGEAQGLPMDKVIDIISVGAAGNWFLEHRGPTMTKSTYAPGFKLALHHKDLKICLDMARLNGTDTTLIEMTLENYEQLMKEGFGDEDISALYRLKRP